MVLMATSTFRIASLTASFDSTECSSQCDDFCERARHARADGEALARCACGTHREHPRRGARRGRDP